MCQRTGNWAKTEWARKTSRGNSKYSSICDGRACKRGNWMAWMINDILFVCFFVLLSKNYHVLSFIIICTVKIVFSIKKLLICIINNVQCTIGVGILLILLKKGSERRKVGGDGVFGLRNEGQGQVCTHKRDWWAVKKQLFLYPCCNLFFVLKYISIWFC